MHLDPRFAAAPDGLMAKLIHGEVGSELAIDPDEQVPVERGGDAERIVVGEQELPLGFHQIDTEEERVMPGDAAAHVGQECRRARRVEVADVRSEEDNQTPATSVSHRLTETIIVGSALRDDTYTVEPGDRSRRQI